MTVPYFGLPFCTWHGHTAILQPAVLSVYGLRERPYLTFSCEPVPPPSEVKEADLPPQFCRGMLGWLGGGRDDLKAPTCMTNREV